MSVETAEQELLELKKKIALAKTEKSQIEGRLLAFQDRFKQELNVDSVEEAEIEVKKMEKEKDELKAKIEKGVASLNAKYSK